jgi:hypothetical protein
VLAWLIAAIIDPDSPHPVLSLFGEQGTAKSTTTRRIVEVVDPSPVPLRKPPRDPEQWVTAAQGSWVVGLDNLSQIPDWLSDCICRAATGDGDVRRALYTDSDLAVFSFRRCIVLNGIDVGALRGDLADRTLMTNLDRIEDGDRRAETQLNEQWQKTYPTILGGLLTMSADVMRLLPSVRLASSPRMADFARILAALDELCGSNAAERYAEQSQIMAQDSLSSDPFLARMDEVKPEFAGRASDLLHQMTPSGDGWRPPRGWPKDPRAVTSILKRNAPALRKAGWVIEDEPGSHRFVIWTITHPEKVRISHRPHRQHHPDTGETDSGCPDWRQCDNGNCKAFRVCVKS